MSNSLRPNGLQHTSPPCPSPTPAVYSDSRPLSRWCHPTILSSVVPFSSCLQSFPASGSFQMSQFFTSGEYWSFSFSISPSNEYLGLISFRIDWFDLLAVQGNLKSLIQNHNLKASILGHSDFLMIRLSHLYMTTGKTIALTICDSWGLRVRHNWATELTIWTFADKVMSLPFNMLSRFVILFFQSTSVF